MRIAALVLGIIGGLAAGGLGINWLNDYYAHREILEKAAALGLGAAVSNIFISAWFLVTGLITGILGGIMVMKGKGKIGGAMMLVTVVGGAIQPMSLVFTFLLLLAAIFAFIAKPKQQQSHAQLRPATAHQ